jgi:hypothetical protein
VLANSASEVLGLGGGFLIAYAIVSALGKPVNAMPKLLLVGMALLLGALEGAVVGIAQWLVLKRRLPAMALHTWILATASGAVVEWFLGIRPDMVMGLVQRRLASPQARPPDVAQVVGAIALGALAGVVLSLGQWIALRRYVKRAWAWIPATGAAWIVGMPIILVGYLVVREGTSALAIGLTVLAVLAIVGAAVGAIQGYALIQLTGPSAGVRGEP